MAENGTPTKRTVTVTLDLTDDDVYAVLVNALRAAADEAQFRAEREGESENLNDGWAEEQERMAQIGRDLVTNIETQIDAAADARKANS